MPIPCHADVYAWLWELKPHRHLGEERRELWQDAFSIHHPASLVDPE